MNRDQAWKLLCEYTQSDSLRKHALAVEAAMRHYARVLGQDEEKWGVTGLIHDFDYERWPKPPDHTREGAKVLREKGVDDEIIGAIMSHADWNLDEFPRDTHMRKALFAVDALCGFLTACALVRPTKLEGLAPKSVKKKMKTAAFAAAVSRDDIRNGAELLGVSLEDHIANCVAAMQSVAGELGLA